MSLGLTDSQDGQQTTFLTPNGQVKASSRGAPVNTVTVQCRCNDKGDAENNALITTFRPLEPGTITIWRFQINSAPSSIAIGFSTEAKFAHGYSCRSITLRQQGNLCNRGCFKSSWGESFGAGDVVDLFVETYPDRLEVYPVLNDKPFGRHFTLMYGAANADEIADVRPLVAFGSGDSEVVVAEYPQPSIQTANTAYRGSIAPRASPEGMWTFPADFDPSVTADWNRYTLNVHNGSIGFHIGNIVRSNAVLQQDGTITLKPGPVISTRMMVHGPGAEAEKLATKWAESLQRWSLESDGMVLNIDGKRFAYRVNNAIIVESENALIHD